MKSILIITIFFYLFFSSHVNAQVIKQEGYLVKGTVAATDSGIIRMLSDNGNSVLDSSLIVNGKFGMKGKIGLPERRLFTIVPGNWSFKAFIEDTTITLTIDTVGAQYYGHGGNKWALLWEIEETGSKLADVYQKFKNETNLKYYNAVFSSLNTKLRSVKNHVDSAYSVEQEIDSVKNLMLTGQKAWIENYLRQYPGSIAGVYLFNEFYKLSSDTSFAYLQSTLDKFSGSAKASVYYKELANKAANLKHVQVNSVAPDFILLKRNKTKFSLSTTRGSYTIIDFWASWCAPCRRAIPNLKKTYTKYHNMGLSIVSVSNDRDWNDWELALKKEQMPWVQVIDEFPKKNEGSLVARLYGVEALPFYVLLDKEGKVILTSGSEEILTKKVAEFP